MIYMDNAATTYPKPVMVLNSAAKAMRKYGGNPGRSGHKISEVAALEIFNTREKVANLFGADVENCAFTLNCTHALNLAIKGIMKNGGHIITSNLEHNSVIRPIHSLEKMGCRYSIAQVSDNEQETIENFKKLITPSTKAIAIMIASNVTGQILPYKGIAKLCKERGICFIADGAQACGVIPINIEKDGINILCSAGHKGLYGPMGTGILVTDGKFKIDTIIEGGTGSNSFDVLQPDFMPDRLEAGTPNTSGIIALGAGIDFIKRKGMSNIYAHDMILCEQFCKRISRIGGVIIYERECAYKRVPIVPFNIMGMNSADLAQNLNKRGFALRGGMHCSYLAHKKLGTSEQGVVRFSPSIMNTIEEVDLLARTIRKIVVNGSIK